MFQRSTLSLVVLSLTFACSDGSRPDTGSDTASPDPLRYEPARRLDHDNVRYYGDEPLQTLELPEPPKSGFRLIAPPKEVEAGGESVECTSWQVPDLKNRWIYTSTLHATPGLHHAVLYGLGIDETLGPESYPSCRSSADIRMFAQAGTVLSEPHSVIECTDPVCTELQRSGRSLHDGACDLGTCSFAGLTVPVVLSANSTQAHGTEQFAFDDGFAFELPGGFEVVTDLHLQNTTPDRLRVESAWDFYTMPADQVTNPTAMFVWFWSQLLIPARSDKTLTTTCEWGGGEVVAIMPHTHQWATGFDVTFGTAEMDGNMPQLGTFRAQRPVYDRTSVGLSDSDIEVYYPPVSTEGSSAVQFRCHFANSTDHEMYFGIGENEMCFLFGYTSPPEGQRIGFIADDSPVDETVAERLCATLDPVTFLNNPLLIEAL